MVSIDIYQGLEESELFIAYRFNKALYNLTYGIQNRD